MSADPNNSRDGTPRSRSKNKRIIIDSNPQNLKSNNNSHQLNQTNNHSNQDIQKIPQTDSITTQITRKIPIDVKKKKVIKVELVQRVKAEEGIPPQAEIQKIHVLKNENNSHFTLPTLKNKVSPRGFKEQIPQNNMEKIIEESISQFDQPLVAKNQKIDKSKFLQKVGSYQSTGDLDYNQEETDQRSIQETIQQLRLKRESKTLPQLHQISPMTDTIDSNTLFGSNTSAGKNIQSHLQEANLEIKMLQKKLNQKENQINQLLQDISSKNQSEKTQSKSIFRKNQHQQPIQLNNLNNRGSGDSDIPINVFHQKNAVVPAVNIKKARDHKTKIDVQKRAISQPGDPLLDQDRDEMIKSIRKSKNKTGGKQKEGSNIDSRGGSAQQNLLQKFQQKEIFEYSPIVQNNYIDSNHASPRDDVEENEEAPLSNRRQAKTVTRPENKKALELITNDNHRESDKLIQLKGQKRQHDTAKNNQVVEPFSLKEERKTSKGPLGTSKMTKKPIKLPFLNPSSRQQTEELSHNNEPNTAELKGRENSHILKNNLIGKYQQYTQVYQKQISATTKNDNKLIQDKHSFSTKNLHNQNSVKAFGQFGQEQQSDSKSNENFGILQKSQSKDSLNFNKIKNQINSNSQNTINAKLQSNRILNKNASQGPIVIKKDQIKLSKIEGYNSNTTFKTGSLQNSDGKKHQPVIMDSSDKNYVQDRFINESVKPSVNENEREMTTNRGESSFNDLEKMDVQVPQSSLTNLGLLNEDNPFVNQNEIQQQKLQQQQQLQQQKYNAYPPPMMFIPPSQLQKIYQNMPPDLMIDPRMNPSAAAMYGMQPPPPGYFIPYPYLPYPSQFDHQQATGPMHPQLIQHPPPYLMPLPYPQPYQQQPIQPQPFLIPAQIHPQQDQNDFILEQKPVELQMEPPPQSIQLEKKLLQENKEENTLKYSKINPFESDDDLCNYDATERTLKDHFGNKILRESVPIVIVDDCEDADVRSSLYSVKSKSFYT